MKRLLIGLALGVLALLALVWFLNLRGEDKIQDAPPPVASAQQVARGAYLARVGEPLLPQALEQTIMASGLLLLSGLGAFLILRDVGNLTGLTRGGLM